MKKSFLKALLIFSILFNCQNLYATDQENLNQGNSYAINASDQTGHSGEKQKPSQRKRPFELKLGDWSLFPSLAYKFENGYDFSLGPKLHLIRVINKNSSIRFSAQYLPVDFEDVDAEMKTWSYRLSYRNFFRPRFFYELGVNFDSFRPSNKARNFVAGKGGLINDKDNFGGSVSIGYEIFKLKYSFRKKQRKLPFYLVATWRDGDDYSFRTDLGDAGTRYRGTRRGWSFRVYPMFMRF